MGVRRGSATRGASRYGARLHNKTAAKREEDTRKLRTAVAALRPTMFRDICVPANNTTLIPGPQRIFTDITLDIQEGAVVDIEDFLTDTDLC